MSGFESPIEFGVNTNRLFMEGLRCVLDVRLRNRSPEDAFSVAMRLSGRALARPTEREFTLERDATLRRTIDLHLPRAEGGNIGSAGDAPFHVELVVDAGEEGKHRFAGLFTLAILAYSESQQNVNVNIGKLIDQSGDKAGMGAINEIDLSNFVSLPGAVSVNDHIAKDRPPRFVAIELDYEGRVKDGADPIIDRGTEAPRRCSIVDVGTGARLLVHTGRSLVLGKSREKADVVTWKMPRDEGNDQETRKISGKQCRLRVDEHGLTLEQLSKVNPTNVNGQVVSSALRVSTDAGTDLLLPADFGLRLTPLPLPALARETLERWELASRSGLTPGLEWSRKFGVGGMLIERDDVLAEEERYLWVFSLVALPESSGVGELRRDGVVALLALPGLHLSPLTAREPLEVAGLQVRDGLAMPIASGDEVVSGATRRRVCDWEQALGL